VRLFTDRVRQAHPAPLPAIRTRKLSTALVGPDSLATAAATYNWMSPGRVTLHNWLKYHVHGYQSTMKTAKYQYFGMEFSRVAAMSSAYQREVWMTNGPDGRKGAIWGIALYMTRNHCFNSKHHEGFVLELLAAHRLRPPNDAHQNPVNPKPPFPSPSPKVLRSTGFTKLAPQGSYPIFLQSSSVCFYCMVAFS